MLISPYMQMDVEPGNEGRGGVTKYSNFPPLFTLKFTCYSPLCTVIRHIRVFYIPDTGIYLWEMF